MFEPKQVLNSVGFCSIKWLPPRWDACPWQGYISQEKIPKIQSLFYLVFPWIHQYPCSDESQVWIEPGFFLDYFVQYRKSVIFPALDIKKQASTWIFRKPRGCTLFYLFSRFGKSVWITKYPDWQTPNLDNLLAKTGFFLNPNLDKSKNNSGI